MTMQGKRALIAVISVLFLSACASKPSLPVVKTAELEAYRGEVPQTQQKQLVVEYTEQAAAKNDDSQYYIVKKGDTLWDISAHFLETPWRWPEIWYVNPQVKNPHLIYPGDEVSLDWVDGKPRFRVNANEKVANLKPKIRAVNERIKAIPHDAINKFLQRPRFVSAEAAQAAPYVLAIEDKRLLGASGLEFYARGFTQTATGNYHVVRLGQAYRDKKGELIGYEAVVAAKAQVVTAADPVVMQVITDHREILANDILIPVDLAVFNEDIYPSKAHLATQGEVIAAYDERTVAGFYDVVTVNLGSEHGLGKGQVLSLERRLDNIEDERTGEAVALPNTQLAYGLSFDVQPQYAHLIILQNNQEVLVGDVAISPAP